MGWALLTVFSGAEAIGSDVATDASPTHFKAPVICAFGPPYLEACLVQDKHGPIKCADR